MRRFPHAPGGMALPFENAPVTIDGMRVLFDTKVALFPIELEKSPADPRQPVRRRGGTRNGRSPGRNRDEL